MTLIVVLKASDIVSKLSKFSYRYIILASKNHNRDKGDGNGIIERFHVFIPVSIPITDQTFYKSCIKSFSVYSRILRGAGPCSGTIPNRTPLRFAWASPAKALGFPDRH